MPVPTAEWEWSNGYERIQPIDHNWLHIHHIMHMY